MDSPSSASNSRGTHRDVASLLSHLQLWRRFDYADSVVKDGRTTRVWVESEQPWTRSHWRPTAKVIWIKYYNWHPCWMMSEWMISVCLEPRDSNYLKIPKELNHGHQSLWPPAKKQEVLDQLISLPRHTWSVGCLICWLFKFHGTRNTTQCKRTIFCGGNVCRNISDDKEEYDNDASAKLHMFGSGGWWQRIRSSPLSLHDAARWHHPIPSTFSSGLWGKISIKSRKQVLLGCLWGHFNHSEFLRRIKNIYANISRWRRKSRELSTTTFLQWFNSTEGRFIYSSVHPIAICY